MKFLTVLPFKPLKSITSVEKFVFEEKFFSAVSYLFTLKNFLKKILKKGLKLKVFNFFFNNFFFLFSLLKKKSNIFSLNINEILNFYSNDFTFFFFVNF